jgi:hypothetical protein
MRASSMKDLTSGAKTGGFSSPIKKKNMNVIYSKIADVAEDPRMMPNYKHMNLSPLKARRNSVEVDFDNFYNKMNHIANGGNHMD